MTAASLWCGSSAIPSSGCSPFFRPVKLEYGEDHRLAALRELSEEVGAVPDELIYLGHLQLPGFCSEVLHMYLARGLHEGPCHPDEDEFLETERIPFSVLAGQVLSGRDRRRKDRSCGP